MGSVAVAKSKPDRRAAARRIAALIEQHMTDSGLSEREKNNRVKQFSKRVDKAIARRAKRA